MADTSRFGGQMPGKSQDTGPTFGQKAQDAASTVGQKAQQAGSAVQEGASNVSERAKDMASNVAEKARDAASTVADKARDLASNVGEKTGDAVTGVGERMSSLAGTIRESAPHEGMIGSAATAVADRLDAGGQYLQQHDLSDMADDMASVVRRYPIQSLAIGFGLGVLLGMAWRR
jgi:ElaB/YqjD/DUF883 family membrane-anchored ribosome-binding protein